MRCELETLARGLSVSETADTCSKCHKGGQICAGAVLRSALFQTLEVALLLGTLRDDSGYDVCVCVSQLIAELLTVRSKDIHNLSVPSPPTLSHVSVPLICPLIFE